MVKKLQIEGLTKEFTIDEDGNIYDILLGRYKKQIVNKKGYMKVTFRINGKTKGFFVHRLVLMHFLPCEDMDKKLVNHIDGNKKNNNISNLEWCTLSENLIHAFSHGLISRKGVKNSQCKMKEEDIINIANMIMENISYSDIKKKYNVSSSLLSSIRNKRLWKDLLIDYDFPKSKYSNVK